MRDQFDTPDWHYLDRSRVEEGQTRIAVPDDVFESGILADPDVSLDSDVGRAHWSYDTATGWVILSDRPLDDEITVQEGKLVEGTVETVRYKSPGTRAVTDPGGERDGFRVTIPRGFFPDSKSDTKVPPPVHIERGEVRHFVTAEEFLSDEPTPTKSCYVLTTDQLNTILRDDYDPSGGDTPRFV